ncbi:MAG: translation initiation factor IF-2 subunit gamma [Candidatus Methanomethylicia archaeon]|nr:translation initiation factor IF-2 subunit gamma [Candidatus Methanomethylicia archaeon]
MQPECNIGTTGHVDHGKTTLVQALTGIWTARHSEELKRGLTLKLGYANTLIRKCPVCPSPERYTTKTKCAICGSDTIILRYVSFVDCPGHEMLMASMLAGATLMDGALMVIDATQSCPQPQTREHLIALEIIGVKNIIILQNKIELADRKTLSKNYAEILNFIKNTIAENAPIIPISALHGINIDVLLQAIEEHIPTPVRDESKPARVFIARSFDVNKPGTNFDKLSGGVIGGSIMQGKISLGDKIEILPGIIIEHDGKVDHRPLYTRVVSLKAGETPIEVAKPGGLIGIGTLLDPSLTKADSLVGNVAGPPGSLPPVLYEFSFEPHLLEWVVGLKEPQKVEPLKVKEQLMINVGTATTLGTVSSISRGEAHVILKRPVCVELNARIAISRRILGRWRLIGYGFIKG